MKFSKKLSKVMAVTAMSAMLLSITASATTVKTPNMTGVSAQYSAMVQAANSFDSSLGNLVADAFTKACYTEEAINNAITNTNNAISAINGIVFYDGNNNAFSTNGTVKLPNGRLSYLRDNGNVAVANSYLQAAQLSGGVSFSLTSSTEGDGWSASVINDSRKEVASGYYDTVTFKASTSLYSTGTTIKVVEASLDSNKAADKTDHVTKLTYNKNALGDIVSKLNKYVTLLNAVKAFDSAAGCYDATSNTTSAPSNTTTAPVDTTSAPSATSAYIDAQDVTIYVGDDFDIMDGVYAYDATGKDVTDEVTTSGEVNTAKAGTYNVTYSLGNISETITVTVLNKSADAIINASDLTVAANSEFDPMAGVTAIDDGGNGADITELLTVTGTVNTSVPGTYKLSYCVIGENGKQVAKEITVTVEKELVNAIIEASDRTILVGEAFDPMEGVSAYDIEGRDKDLTDQVKVDGKVDTSKEGEYELTYSVTGNSGVEVSTTVTITVVREIKDAVIMAYDRTVGCDSDFEPMKDVKALDNNGAGKIITGDVEVDGYVDTKVEGDYPITYSVIGSNGIKVTKDVTITVSCDVDNCDEDTTEEPWEDTTVEDTTWEDTTEEPLEPVDTTSAPTNTTCAVEPVCVVPVLFPVGWVIPLGTVDTTCAPVVNTTCAPVVDTTCVVVEPVNTTCVIVDTTCAPVVDTTCVVVAPVDTTCAPVVDTTCVVVEPVDTTCVVVAPVDTTCAPVVDTTCVVVEPVDTTCVVVAPVDTTCAPVVDTTCVVVEPVDTTCAPVVDTTCVVVEPVDTTCVEIVEPVDTTCAPVEEPVDTTCVEVVEPVDTTCAPVEEPVDTTCVEVVEPVDTTCAPVEEPVDTTCVEVVEPVDTTCAPVEEPVDTTCVEVVEPVDTTCAPVEEPVDTTCEPIKIVVDPIKVEIIKTETVDTTCEEVIIVEEPTPAPADTTEEVVVVEVPENTMKPTGANLAELVFSTLSLLGTAVFAKKRR